MHEAVLPLPAADGAGTPEYMAPEMFNETPYDTRLDVYSFGLCLLELDIHEFPFSECDSLARIFKKVSAVRAPPSPPPPAATAALPSPAGGPAAPRQPP